MCFPTIPTQNETDSSTTCQHTQRVFMGVYLTDPVITPNWTPYKPPSRHHPHDTPHSRELSHEYGGCLLVMAAPRRSLSYKSTNTRTLCCWSGVVVVATVSLSISLTLATTPCRRRKCCVMCHEHTFTVVRVLTLQSYIVLLPVERSVSPRCFPRLECECWCETKRVKWRQTRGALLLHGGNMYIVHVVILRDMLWDYIAHHTASTSVRFTGRLENAIYVNMSQIQYATDKTLNDFW